MVVFDSQNFHFDYIDITRHWSPISQRYAGGDALVTFLSDGWAMSEQVYREEHWNSGRVVNVYYFELHRDGESVMMAVISNPYVDRLVDENDLHVMPMAVTQRDHYRQQQHTTAIHRTA